MRPEVEAEIRAAWAREKDRRDFPSDGGGHVAGDVYGAPERHARELARVFARAWQPVARAGELEGPGTFRALDLGGHPVAVLRGADGALRAVRNVCTHRGAQVLRVPAGRAERLVCPYHGFAYDLTGACTARPGAASFGAGEARGLAPLPLAEWGGWVWVAASAEAAPLDTFLGPDLLDELREWPFADLELYERRTFDADFDWKIGVEAFLEPLHLPAIHPQTAHPLLDWRGTAIAALGDHSRMSTPFRSARSYDADGPLGQAAAAAGMPPFAGLNFVQRASNNSYLVFPATVLNLLPNHLTVFRILPLAPGRTRLEHELLAAPARDGAARDYVASLGQGYARLLQEDLDNLPWIQRGVAAGGSPRLALSWYERRIVHFRQALARWMDEPA